jgi:hypothetical protein
MRSAEAFPSLHAPRRVSKPRGGGGLGKAKGWMRVHPKGEIVIFYGFIFYYMYMIYNYIFPVAKTIPGLSNNCFNQKKKKLNMLNLNKKITKAVGATTVVLVALASVYQLSTGLSNNSMRDKLKQCRADVDQIRQSIDEGEKVLTEGPTSPSVQMAIKALEDAKSQVSSAKYKLANIESDLSSDSVVRKGINECSNLIKDLHTKLSEFMNGSSGSGGSSSRYATQFISNHLDNIKNNGIILFNDNIDTTTFFQNNSLLQN